MPSQENNFVVFNAEPRDGGVPQSEKTNNLFDDLRPQRLFVKYHKTQNTKFLFGGGTHRELRDSFSQPLSHKGLKRHKEILIRSFSFWRLIDVVEVFFNSPVNVTSHNDIS